MTAFTKLLGLIAFLFLASHANAFTSMSPVAGNQVQEKHWFQFEEPMNDPTIIPTREQTCKPTTDQMNDHRTKRLKLVALPPVNQSSKQVMFCDKGKDDEILSKLHNSSNTQPDWHGPKPIGMGQNKRSFKASARVPFTAIRTNLSSGLTID
jgi:hypothetical protein